MARHLAATLYFLTAIATLIAGLASFNYVYAIIRPVSVRSLASFAILDFAVPTIFLLASFTIVWTSNKSTTARWITAAPVFVGLVLVFIQYRIGWKPFLGAAGTLISAVFVVGSLVKEASVIAGLAIVIYAVVQGPDLISHLHQYWAFGGSVQHLFVMIVPPALVAASFLVAAYSYLGIRDTDTRFGSTR
jgi:hypothetical protein